MSLQPWADEGTIGAGLQATATFRVQNRVLRLHIVSMVNDTRPKADPRPCWAYVIRGGATEGVEIGVGECSNYNDFVITLPQDFTLGPEDTLKMEIRGENGDTWKANILYSVVKE